jgi:hypothetical protein
MFNTIRSRRSSMVRQLGFAFGLLLLLALLVPSLSLAGPSNQTGTRGDLGDAPDSTNHFGLGMTAYPGIKGFFPTVFDPSTGLPQGPVHLSPKKDAWLGNNITAEFDADLLPDADGITNIAPSADSPNRDRADDGVFSLSPTMSLPQCGTTQFRYIVTGAPAIPAHRAFVNVWYDFNRDGDWNDKFVCQTPTGVFTITEWAVQNQVVNVVPGSAVWSTPLFRSFHNSTIPMLWMRITLSDTKPPLAASGLADGSGPPNGYRTGETEDYILKLCTTCPSQVYSGS